MQSLPERLHVTAAAWLALLEDTVELSDRVNLASQRVKR